MSKKEERRPRKDHFDSKQKNRSTSEKKTQCVWEKRQTQTRVFSSLSVGIESATHPKIEVGKWRTSFVLQESTVLKQLGHLLVFPFSRFSLQTEIPELVAVVNTVDVFVEGVLEEGEDGADTDVSGS